MKKALSTVVALLLILGFALPALAYDYSFSNAPFDDYYPSTNYEDRYNGEYNYGGPNEVDYDIPELEYGLGGSSPAIGLYGIRHPADVQLVAGEVEFVYTDTSDYFIDNRSYWESSFSYTSTGFTSTDSVRRSDGSIGTVYVGAVGKEYRVYEGTDNTAMSRGMGHFPETSAWDGNVGLCVHNRGASYTLDVSKLDIGDVISYTTSLGTRDYEIVRIEQIGNSDWSYLQQSVENRLTIVTCVSNRPELRYCVQAVEIW